VRRCQCGVPLTAVICVPAVSASCHAPIITIIHLQGPLDCASPLLPAAVQFRMTTRSLPLMVTGTKPDEQQQTGSQASAQNPGESSQYSGEESLSSSRVRRPAQAPGPAPEPAPAPAPDSESSSATGPAPEGARGLTTQGLNPRVHLEAPAAAPGPGGGYSDAYYDYSDSDSDSDSGNDTGDSQRRIGVAWCASPDDGTPLRLPGSGAATGRGTIMHAATGEIWRCVTTGDSTGTVTV